MIRAKYLMAIFIGTFVYVALSVSVGKNGLLCCKFMEEQKLIVSKQASDIQNINSELNLELSALKNDKDVIAAYARKLDYVGEGEKLVKINGLKPAQTTLYDTGSVIRHENPTFLPEKYCKILSLFFGLMSFVIFFMYDISRGNFKKRRKGIVKGIPVYDVPQV